MSSDIIHLLPDSVANQIAAGEVIQRPASVVKELVENAIDAGATAVDIIVKDAGRTLIQVVDNGCGMSVTDARMAFERHATSKISQAVDLYSLHTMGFRGEALPSIAAVSEIDMRTMRRGDTNGTRLLISASRVESQQPEACIPGTNIMVKRLFFNLPARRKFLKKDSVELSHIVREFERLALVNTGVTFSLTHNDVLIHQLLPGTLKQRIGALFGNSMEHGIIPIEADTSIVKISGFVGLPQSARRRNAQQFFFANGRNMRHPYFHKAVMECYAELIAADTQPNYFINITVDPDTIDVNIHPQKHEIKFENEQAIWQILSAAVREGLGKYNAAPSIDFDRDGAPEIPVFNPFGEPAQLPIVDVDPTFNPFATQGSSGHRSAGATTRPSAMNHGGTAAPADWQKLYDKFYGMPDDTPQQPAAPALIDSHETAAEGAPAMFQLKERFIVSPSKSGLMIVDQHRAHQCVLFQRFMDMVQQGPIPSQRLIFPDSITFEPDANVVMASITETMATMGFDMANLGNCSWSINAVPAILGDVSPVDAVADIVNTVAEDADTDINSSLWQKIALSMARSAAVKPGTPLSQAEMDAIVTDLMKLPTPNYTPDGRITLRIIEMQQIADLFSRLM